ncbi:hypothetical protein [Ideonella sp.]|uniref:hypothetical protein n=1 Tax=Ideonella sp. TaxID=1929293 RepID=UPI002B49D91F|nr:hypothetical protein [Ideonella sp.]HJV67723.1 hypothetical protein [Ideonella sp.]
MATRDAVAALDTATQEENERITNAFIATSNALGDAIIALKRIQAVTFDHDSLDELVLERRRLEDEAAANERAFLAYMDGTIGMHPPEPEDVSAIVALAGELAILTQQKATAAAVLALANDVNARFQAIKVA